LELYQDEDEVGKFFYLVIPYDGVTKLGGFLANENGDLIDNDSNILTSIEELKKMMEDKDFNEYEEDVTGILIKDIELGEIIPSPEKELKEEINACSTSSGRIDGFVHQEVPVILKKPCFYEKPVPVPVYRKK
jgi:hypothetical protein